MGMDQAQPPQCLLAKGVVVKGRNDNFPLITNNNVGNFADTIDQDADLASDFAGDACQLTGQIKRDQFTGWDTPTIEPLKCLQLTLF